MIHITDAAVDYFNKNWNNIIKDLGIHSNIVGTDHSQMIGLIKDMKLKVTPREDDIVVNGWKYQGYGDLDLDVYLNVDHILEFPIDQYMFAGRSILPWLNKGVLKYFGMDVYNDFADVNVYFHDNMGDVDTYPVSVEDVNTNLFYKYPNKNWKNVQEQHRLDESVIEEGIFKTKSLYLTFPKKGWETIGAYLMKALGVVTGVFTNVSDAIKTIRKKRKRVDGTLNELVIGSHGNGEYLLMGGGKNGYPVDDILREVKDLVGSNTTVFFTACHGADFLINLCHASAILDGNRVYGSAGIYNYISNSSEKGFYSCQMSSGEYESIRTDYYKRKEIFGDDMGNSYFLNNGYCQRESKAPINWVKNIWT